MVYEVEEDCETEVLNGGRSRRRRAGNYLVHNCKRWNKKVVTGGRIEFERGKGGGERAVSCGTEELKGERGGKKRGCKVW